MIQPSSVYIDMLSIFMNQIAECKGNNGVENSFIGALFNILYFLKWNLIALVIVVLHKSRIECLTGTLIIQLIYTSMTFIFILLGAPCNLQIGITLLLEEVALFIFNLVLLILEHDAIESTSKMGSTLVWILTIILLLMYFLAFMCNFVLLVSGFCTAFSSKETIPKEKAELSKFYEYSSSGMEIPQKLARYEFKNIEEVKAVFGTGNNGN